MKTFEREEYKADYSNLHHDIEADRRHIRDNIRHSNDNSPQPLHWTKRIKLTSIWRRICIKRTERRVVEFRMHLLSAKFHTDTTIQVGDVQSWLDYVAAPLKDCDDK